MIKINLLPDEFKKVQKPKRSFEFDIPVLAPRLLKLTVSFLSILVGLHFLLCVSILLKGNSLKRLNSNWQRLGPDKTEIENLNGEVASIERVLEPAKRLVEKRMLWSRELNQLSSVTTPGVWLTKLFVQTQVKDVQKGKYARMLNMEGSAASLYGDETALIARFVNALQDDKEFFQYFSEIKLGPMERTVVDKIPVMNFKIFCAFKEND